MLVLGAWAGLWGRCGGGWVETGADEAVGWVWKVDDVRWVWRAVLMGGRGGGAGDAVSVSCWVGRESGGAGWVSGESNGVCGWVGWRVVGKEGLTVGERMVGLGGDWMSGRAASGVVGMGGRVKSGWAGGWG